MKAAAVPFAAMGAHANAFASGAESFAALRQYLGESRRRGLSFEDAWQGAATDRVLPPPGDDRDVLEASRPAWRRAFYREAPGRLEAAVGRLAEALADEADAESGRRPVLS